MKKMSVEVETNSGPAYGRTIADWFNVTSKNKNINVATNGNSDEFFRPLMESLQEYSGLGSSETITFVFKLIYFNSSSARVLMKLFELLDEMAEERNVEIEWHYHEEDDTMEEFGEDFSDDIENVNFKLISYSDD